MSFYRIYVYPMRKKQFRHLYFTRDRGGGEKASDKASENSGDILKKLESLEKSSENLSRARRTIRDLILCNQFDYFCTFTFNAEKVNRYDFKSCKKKITEVFKNYKNRYSPDFRYLIVPEFHKNGAVHFHGMVKGIREGDLTTPDYIWKRNRRTDELILVPNTKKYVDWSYYSSKLGFFSCSRIKHYEACAKYVSKYVTKDLMSLPLGQRVFMASENLSRPELAFDEDNIPLCTAPDFQNEFVCIKDSGESFGLVPDWWGECCSDLDDADQDDDLKERDIFFPRLTGSQLSLC